jgi:hypothetical protein
MNKTQSQVNLILAVRLFEQLWQADDMRLADNRISAADGYCWWCRDAVEDDVRESQATF